MSALITVWGDNDNILYQCDLSWERVAAFARCGFDIALCFGSSGKTPWEGTYRCDHRSTINIARILVRWFRSYESRLLHKWSIEGIVPPKTLEKELAESRRLILIIENECSESSDLINQEAETGDRDGVEEFLYCVNSIEELCGLVHTVLSNTTTGNVVSVELG